MGRVNDAGRPLGHYRDWADVDYIPAITSLVPESLLTFLRPGSQVLDVGCGKGDSSIYLAAKGFEVLGVDINASAIQVAAERAAVAGISKSPTFVSQDFLTIRGMFDAVIMSRFLTCFPDALEWHQVLEHARSLVRPQGYCYVHDFIFDPANPCYAARYRAGMALGKRDGTFPISGGSFLAHHHTEKEVAHICGVYRSRLFRKHPSVSMNGNPCMMFEFIGENCGPDKAHLPDTLIL